MKTLQQKAGLEWTLVTTSYNIKRLFNAFPAFEVFTDAAN